MHTFVYARVSTADQSVDNQLLEIRAAGYDPDSVYTEVVSGKVPAAERPQFNTMLSAIHATRKPKRLVVSKLDRLGRDSVDITSTIRNLAADGTQVRVLQLGDLDLTSTAGKLVLATLAAVAEMERDILIERTMAGINRARQQGKHIGRPKAADKDATASIYKMLSNGVSVSQIAREHSVSRATVQRIRDRV